MEGGGGRGAHTAQWQAGREVSYSYVGWGQKRMDRVMEENETSGNRTQPFGHCQSLGYSGLFCLQLLFYHHLARVSELAEELCIYVLSGWNVTVNVCFLNSCCFVFYKFCQLFN